MKKLDKQSDEPKGKIPERLQATAWKPGQSGNPAGRPLGARTRIAESLIADIEDVWRKYGKNVLVRLAANDPGTLAKIAYGLLPKDVFITVHQPRPGNLDPEQWEILRNVVDLIQANQTDGADLGMTLALIENALRAERATQIEHEKA